MSAKNWQGKARVKGAKGANGNSDSRTARAEANQRFVRETLVQRQPRYARAVERAAETLVRGMTQRRSVAQDAIVAEVRDALAAA